MNDDDGASEIGVRSDNAMPQTSLADGQIEERIQVDRKRLEAMITGEPLYGSDKHLPSAEDFFLKVSELSGALISWPSRLKIGAKTKKDPFVKVLGTAEQVNCARQLIASMLKIKRDRITLKIEIPHTEHSKIIGRRGRNTQDIMRETMCHIHFPDSNKNHDMEKNNQVSISGSVGQVEKARKCLRNLSPLSITFDLPNSCRYPLHEVQRAIGVPELFVTFHENYNGTINCTIKGTQQQEVCMVKAVMIIADIFQLQGENSIVCQTILNMRSSLRSNVIGEDKVEQLQCVAQQTSTSIQCTGNGCDGVAVLISGTVAGVIIARKYIIGLMPVALHFDRVVESDYDLVDKSAIEKEFGLIMNEKWRKNQNFNNVSLIVLSSVESNVSSMYEARDRILKVVQNVCDAVPDVFQNFKNGNTRKLVDILRFEAQQLLCDSPQHRPSLSADSISQLSSMSHKQIEASVANCLYAHQSTLADALIDAPNTDKSAFSSVMPNPTDSPIAHSLLTGVKRIDQKRSEQERVQTREQLLLKANRAVYDTTPSSVRHPTDFWAGYGFSNSLPAEILKSGMSLFDNSPTYEGRPILSQESKLNDSSAHRSLTPSMGLASVLEEDEHVDLGAHDSSNSNSNSLLSSSSFHNLTHLQQAPPQPPIGRRTKRDFSASTGIFESSPLIGNDLLWDIRVFVDPAMVLAQLGCSEYLAQFRDQEIDMEAFLLLDEQNLKDIGVSTMGARKKLYNAILKLRESARLYGMRL
ncbi:Protein bicaudal C -like protein 1 [Toxocara canis]|uniref:Protein bicaudal C-like protein 1 n=1 Tax=Toxocara canis TaxID=6265 RepID=A0A0B2VVY9_TOXCA|nr:Protein bicaudal C -like protein 1 [Toxocara canis]